MSYTNIQFKDNAGNILYDNAGPVTSSATVEGISTAFTDITIGDGTLEFDAVKESGNEGFIIAFAYADSQNYIWLNLGGWSNTSHSIEAWINGARYELTDKIDGSIETGRTYHIKVVRNNGRALCYLDDELIYTVTMKIVGDAIFSHCTGPTSVTIPDGVTRIGNEAFNACSGLTTVTSYIEEPFAFGADAFNGIADGCILYVPAGTRDAYIAAGWTEDVFKGGVIEMEGEVDETNQLLPSDASILRGSQVNLPIQLANTTDNVVGVSYTLTLPEGVTAATDEDGELVYTLNDSRVNNKHFSVTAAQLSDGSWGVRLYTTNANGVIQGNEGEIMTITLNVDGAMEAGDYQISLTGNKLSIRDDNNNVSTLNISDAVSTLTVTALAMGDVNGDEEVDLSDAIMVIYHSLQQTASNFHVEVADMNSDGEIDLSDAITIIYKSLGMISNQAKGREGAVALNDTFDRLTADTEGNSCVLQLTNDNAYLGLQFDVELPTGMALDDILLSNERAKDFSVFYNSVDEDTYRVMLFSTGGKAFKGTDGELLRLVTAGTGNGLLRLSNIFGVNSRLEKKHFDGININATGIRSLTTDTDKLQNSYDLSGRKANKLQNGVMIINGKKVFVK